jgi:hypothetical protein
MQRPTAVALALALGACGSAPTPQPRFARTTLHVPEGPQRALVQLKADAASRGWRVVDEGLDTLVVDFGVATARVPVPTDDGRVALRDTEVHATALFKFDAAPQGADVTMWNNPIYWHPDYRVWLPAPDDLAPGDVLLGALCGDPPYAATPGRPGREPSAR